MYAYPCKFIDLLAVVDCMMESGVICNAEKGLCSGQ